MIFPGATGYSPQSPNPKMGPMVAVKLVENLKILIFGRSCGLKMKPEWI